LYYCCTVSWVENNGPDTDKNPAIYTEIDSSPICAELADRFLPDRNVFLAGVEPLPTWRREKP
jgi:hypothetical protein